MNRNRAWRRRQKRNALHHAYHIMHDIWKMPLNWGARTNQTIDDVWDMAKAFADNMKKCGGDCCKNPRHCGWYKGNGKLTIQERRELEDNPLIDIEEEYEDLEN